jgi:polyferredoxin
MLDEDSITVAYRDWRGEPRGKLHKGELAEGQGDCIDCMACVNVCPMGIDIRNGQQLACITCALCIDACNDVMDKIGKPRGLIDYLALTDETSERAGNPPKSVWKHVFRPARCFTRCCGRVWAWHWLWRCSCGRDRRERDAGAQPDLRHHVRRVDPQFL